MERTISFGKVATYGNRPINEVTLEVRLETTDPDKPRFSVSGNVWNASQTDIVRGGQCIDTIWNEYGTQLNNPELYQCIMGLWERNHLNDMNAGCEHQREMKRNNDNIESPCPVCGYRYGSAWLYRPISDDDMHEIKQILGID